MVERLIAYKIRVIDILSGVYIKGSEEFDPDVINVNGLKISRVNLMGFVVNSNNQDNFESLSFDDGTAVIEVRNFGSDLLSGFNVGDCVNIIGRVKEYGNLRYVVCESCKVIDKEWLKYRQKELELENRDFVSGEELVVDDKKEEKVEKTPNEVDGDVGEEELIEDEKKDIFNEISDSEEKQKLVEDSVKEKPELDEKIEEDENPIEVLLNTIRELDKGYGVDVDELISLKGSDVESLITTLLQEGELFEVKPGMVKVLE